MIRYIHVECLLKNGRILASKLVSIFWYVAASRYVRYVCLWRMEHTQGAERRLSRLVWCCFMLWAWAMLDSSPTMLLSAYQRTSHHWKSSTRLICTPNTYCVETDHFEKFVCSSFEYGSIIQLEKVMWGYTLRTTHPWNLRERLKHCIINKRGVDVPRRRQNRLCVIQSFGLSGFGAIFSQICFVSGSLHWSPGAVRQ